MILILIIAALLSGLLITYIFTNETGLVWRAAAGLCIGLALQGLVGFVIASLAGLTPATAGLSIAISTLPVLLIFIPKFRESLRSDTKETTRIVRRSLLHPQPAVILHILLYVSLVVLLFTFFSRTVMEKSDGIYTGIHHNLGDLPLHIGIIKGFHIGDNYPPQHPEFAGTRLTYPFIVDFLSSLWITLGTGLSSTINIQGFILTLAIFILFHRWALGFTGDKLASFFSLILVLFCGGLGWTLIFNDVSSTGGSIFSVMNAMTHDYTIGVEGYRWGNILTTLLVTQRSFLLGMPIFFIVVTLWWQIVTDQDPAWNLRKMIAAAILTGFLPLFHAHTFLTLMMVASGLALIFRKWKLWIYHFAIALVLALPLIFYLSHGSSVSPENLIGWHFGWDKGEDNFFLFWFRNTGLFIPLLIIALALPVSAKFLNRRVLLFYLPFTLCFIVPNLIKLAPWEWDNNKVMVYWYLASAPIVSLLLAYLWRMGGGYIALSLSLLLAMTLAGFFDVYRIISKQVDQKVFGSDGVEFAKMAVEKTPPRSLLMGFPTFDHPVLLTGRRSLMGYPGHLWAHGLKYEQREADIKRIYEGAPEAPQLLKDYKIEYVIVGPLERSNLTVNDQFFESYHKVGELDGYQLYKVN
jgi:hypothetical protein